MLSKKVFLLDFINKGSNLSVSDVAHHFMKPDGSDSKVWYGYLRELREIGAVSYLSADNMSCSISITSLGKELLEKELRQEQERNGTDEKTKRIFRHEWFVAVFGALLGSLLSRPVWALIDWLWALISAL